MKGKLLLDEKIYEVTGNDIIEYAKLNSVDVATLTDEESEQLMEKIKLNKKQKEIRKFVSKYHLNADNLPRKIYAPKKDNGYWYTQHPNNPRNKLYARSENELYEKLFEIYSEYEKVPDYTVRTWYEIGIQHRKMKTNPRSSTIDRHNRTKQSYFTDRFLSLDVREITSTDIWEFMREVQQTHNFTLSEAKQLKGTLNIIFDAASDPEIGCRNYNPILTINPVGLFKNNPVAIKNEQKQNSFSAFSDEQINTLRAYFRKRIEDNRNVRYDFCKYAFMGLLASYTGMRASELPALRWDDVYPTHIHIHQMQVRNDGLHGDERFEIVPWLKEEKGQPRGGRMIPFLDTHVPELLSEIREVQKGFGIESEWIFPNSDNQSYERSLYKVCKKFGFEITNNHAFRKGFNMWMVSLGLNEAERASILGHSTIVNLSKYTVTSDNWIDKVLQKARQAQMSIAL